MSHESIGAALAEARAGLGLTLEDVAEVTRSRTALLRAMEAGDFSACGATVYARGHIRAFAHAVDLDPGPLLAQLGDDVEEVGDPISLVIESPLGARDGLLRGRRKPPWLAVGTVAAGGLTVLAVVSFALGGGSQAPTPARASEPLGAVATPAAAAAVAGPVAPAGPTIPATATDGPVSVTVQIKDAASWVGFYAPGSHQLAFQGVLAPGTTKEFTGADAVSLRIGKPEAVEVFVNGRSVGSPGRAGQPTDVTYGPQGAQSSQK